MRSKNLTSTTASPTHALLSPIDNKKILNFINFNNLGSNTLTASNAFKKIQQASKVNNHELFNLHSDEIVKYNKLQNLFFNDLNIQTSYLYGSQRQQTYSASLALKNNFTLNLDNKSVSQILNYNFDQYFNKPQSTNNYATPVGRGVVQTSMIEQSSTGLEMNSKKNSTQINLNANTSMLMNNLNNLQIGLFSQNSIKNLLATDLVFKNLYIKSSNQQVLTSEKNIRNTHIINPQKINYNIGFDKTVDVINQSRTGFAPSHLPTVDLSNKLFNQSFDKFEDNNQNSQIFSTKEDLAPTYLFSPY
jgi:hypothetical protein